MNRSRILTIAVGLSAFVILPLSSPANAGGKKDDAVVVPAAMCRLLSVGDHWVFDLNRRTPKAPDPRDQNNPIGALLNMNASDNSHAKLDIRVLPPVADESAPAGDAAPADGSLSPQDTPGPQGDYTGKGSGTAPATDATAPATGNPTVPAKATENADEEKVTPILSLMMSLSYDQGGRKVQEYTVYNFQQVKATGRLVMQNTKNPAYMGQLVPGVWGVGQQFTAFFPVGFIWRLLPSLSDAIIVGTEKVKLKSGEFNTWKVSQQEHALGSYHTDPELANFWWYDPSVVFPVKAQTDYASGAQFFLTLTTFEPAPKPSGTQTKQ